MGLLLLVAEDRATLESDPSALRGFANAQAEQTIFLVVAPPYVLRKNFVVVR
jgi:hypothetical protein